MEPFVYDLSKSPNENIDTSNLKLVFSSNPIPKLVKFGFNNLASCLNIINLTSSPYYRVGLNFDFERTDDKSITSVGRKYFNTQSFDQTFAELWEVLVTFNLFDTNKTVYCPDIEPTMNSIINVTRNKLNIVKQGKADLVIYRYSDIDIDENVANEFIIRKLSDLFNKQKKGSNMIIQLFDMQTSVTAQLLTYLSREYESLYIIKPLVVSQLSNTKYVVLTNLLSDNRDTSAFSNVKKFNENTWLESLFINSSETIDKFIQCINYEYYTIKFVAYSKIKSYLDLQVYEGATRDEFISKQDINTTNWIQTYSNPSTSSDFLDKAIKRANDSCNRSIDSLIN